MQKRSLWFLLFLLVPLFGVGAFVVAPFKTGWWFPESVSTYGKEIDKMFYVILVITGVAFILTQVALVYFLYRYAGKAGNEAHYIHHHHKVEMVWTVIPALILVFIALYQMGVWKQVKFQKTFPKEPPLALVMPAQFEWRIQYAGEDKQFWTDDDVYDVNQLHIPANENVVIQLRAQDVLHSFFVPAFRIKQDAVPGMTIPVWFNVTKIAKYELVCAELCGWGHYNMRGMVTVESREDFNKWLKQKRAEQEEAQ